jgi:hypothetical protein
MLIVTDVAENVARHIATLTRIKAHNRCNWIPNLQRKIVLTKLGAFLKWIHQGGKVYKFSIKLVSQPKFKHFLNSMSTLLYIYIKNKQIFRSDCSTFGSLSEEEHCASLNLMFIIAVHKGCRHVGINVNHNTKAYLLQCLKRVFVVWRGVIFGHLTTDESCWYKRLLWWFKNW